MPYDLTYNCEDIDLGEIFQHVERTLGVYIAGNATDPLDYDEYLIPRTTAMAPVRQQSDAVGATTHDMGLWMPIRRALVLTVPVGGLTFTVVDADPFKIGDHIVSIDATGPVTGAGLNLGVISNINYTTNLITVAATLGLAQNDWVEVWENCCVKTTAYRPTAWQSPMVVGMLLCAHDTRLKASDTSGVSMPATVVTQGAIREADINFPDDATDDLILIPQMAQFNIASGGIQIITLEHSDEAVNLPDWP